MLHELVEKNMNDEVAALLEAYTDKRGANMLVKTPNNCTFAELERLFYLPAVLTVVHGDSGFHAAVPCHGRRHRRDVDQCRGRRQSLKPIRRVYRAVWRHQGDDQTSTTGFLVTCFPYNYEKHIYIYYL